MKKTSILALSIAINAVLALAIWTPAAEAYQEYSAGCQYCHGGFMDNPYIAPSDGANWGADLMSVHMSMVSNQCEVCHSSGARAPTFLNSSDGVTGLDPISCIGCHGRAEDRTGACVGTGGLGPCGDGAGLRQRHFNAGVTNCVGCHDDANPASYTPVGENVPPPYYFTPDTSRPNKPTDPCNPSAEELYGSPTLGLDNDGDGIYDTADPDCGDLCTGVVCSPTGNDCTVNVCDPTDGLCKPQDVGDGTSCDDGAFCTVGDTCLAGVCLVGGPRNCDDGQFCTGAETCNEGTDTCDSSGNPCDPATHTCNEVTDLCDAGPDLCASVVCPPPGNDCTLNVCDPADGLCKLQNAGTGFPCSDGEYCTAGDACDGLGACVPGGPRDCSDGVGCTDDSCDESQDICVNAANHAYCPDDGQFCTGTESCDPVSDCSSTGNPCAVAEICDEWTDTCRNPDRVRHETINTECVGCHQTNLWDVHSENCAFCHGPGLPSPPAPDTDCVTCHVDPPHGGGGCITCHDQERGSLPRRQIVENNGDGGGDFVRASHHVYGSVESDDCMTCHYLGDHGSQVVKLKDPDQGESVVYAYDPADPAGLESFCLNCHDADGALAGGGTQPFSDGRSVPNIKEGAAGSLWANSAHNLEGYAPNDDNPISCFGDGTSGCHSNAHGSDNVKLLSAAAAVSIDQFCYNCHTEGKLTNNAISGGTLADDIEQAFGFGSANKHDLGATFTLGGNTYTLQCTTCHNPHLATGKYWEADLDLTPVTRPDFSDPANNPRAMGSTLWGDTAGEKMDDYGGTYRTPNGETFSGAQLPDYNRFCLDCHDPMPDPRDEPGAHGQIQFDDDPHGLNSANSPNGGDLCPNRYTCGKGDGWDGDDCVSDDATCWPVIARGKGDQLWSRGPYNHEERIDGANFALSCTNCHEAHGSAVRSMIRSNPNGGTGTTIWNTMCNNCHYYYSDWHAGMSCGNASCHVSDGADRMYYTGTDTLHRMGNRYGTGATRTFDPELVLDMRFENNLKDSGTWRLHGTWRTTSGSFASGRSGNAVAVNDNPIEVGTRNSYWSTDEGNHGTWKYSEMKYNMTLEAWVYPTDATGTERKILAKHTYGTGGYALVLRSIDGTWRAGLLTNVNGGANPWRDSDCNGLRGAFSTVSIPLNEWTQVAATYDWTGPDRDDNDGSVGRVRIYVSGEDVTDSYSDVAQCYAQPGAGEDAMFPHSDWNDIDPATMCFDGHWCASALSVGGINWSDANGNFIGRLDEVKVWNVTKNDAYFDLAIPPSMTSVAGIEGSRELIIEFSEGVYSNPNGTGSLDSGDFVLTCGGKTITGPVTHVAGSTTVVVTLDAGLDPGDIGTCTLTPNADSIYDEYGNAVPADSRTITERADPPSISSAEGVTGFDRVCVRFSERVYTGKGSSGALETADFSVSSNTVDSVWHEAGGPSAALVLTNPPTLATDTVAAVGDQIYDQTDVPVGTQTVTIQPAPAAVIPTITSVEGILGGDTLEVTFKSQVYSDVGESGALEIGDFVLTGSNSITAVSHTAGGSVAFLEMNTVLAAGDFTQTLAAASGEIFGPTHCSFPASTAAVSITQQAAAPSITRVEGALGFDQLFVSFSEAVYTGTGRSGALVLGDLNFTDGDLAGAASIIDVAHTAGDSTAIITLNTALLADDVVFDTVAASGNEIFNNIDNPVGTGAVAITENGCPAWGTSFPIEDEAQSSPTISDDSGLLTGTVGNQDFVFPYLDNDWFNGAEGQGTYVDITNNNACLNSPRAFTIEARVKPTEVDRGVADNTFNRIFERRRTFLVTILNTDYRGDDIPSRSNKASIEVKYRVDAASRHSCPHPQWPEDTYVGNDVRMHQISSDINQWPMYNDHWYQVKVVFNSDKSDVPDSNGTPVDIFIDDQGVDGSNTANPNLGNPTLSPDYEQWPDYVNASVTINGSSSCKWGSLPGDFLEFRSDTSHIGASWSHAQPFAGQIDWVTWQPVADYSGVNDPPPMGTPSITPTHVPTDTPTLLPTSTPTITPSAATAVPTDTPVVQPTATATASPTDTPVVQPTATATASPTYTPVVQPTATATASPTDTPAAQPTDTPGQVPGCGNSSAPQCDGECPLGQACQDIGGTCWCTVTAAPCGAAAGAPLCWGTCLEGEACVDVGGSCQCQGGTPDTPTETPTETGPTSTPTETPTETGPTSTPTETPTVGCAPAPVPGCFSPAKSILLIKDKPPAGGSAKDKLFWKWIKGTSDQGDFGDPVAGSIDYTLCMYDSAGLITQIDVPGGGTCAGDPCWKPISTKGYRYKDKTKPPGNDGVQKLILKGNPSPGRAKIILKAKADSLPVPTLPLDDTTAVTVQMHRSDGSTCWESVLPGPARTNTSEMYKDKAP